ncbi:unnamed protein product [Darwinula stevensoni]|uniref:EGF-like domain-containing protein n=1 Tax=Darwinula stevensoni TaxID=69355 RepID=A0A7R8XKC0_9CRUS|nr:unnamed protein product [Darwinula stevensoni]CAG0895590.1 unnamed protein product [Darwinula stevensoni]
MKVRSKDLLLIFALVHRAVALTGPHVCTRQEMRLKPVNVTYAVPFQFQAVRMRKIVTVSTYKVAYKTEGGSCETACPRDRWGRGCVNRCECRGGRTCDPKSGGCTCMEGWTGRDCEKPCPGDRWGPECRNECDCRNGGICDVINGRCSCPPGYTGQQCQSRCPPDRFGVDCHGECKCENNGTCSFVDGRCSCEDGWIGPVCSERLCPYHLYGPDCSRLCDCESANTEACHPWRGCACKSGWEGPTCSVPCRGRTYGKDCRGKCECRNGASCHHVSGACVCSPGANCQGQCKQGSDNYCDAYCNCRGNSECDPRLKKCICKVGWQGPNCDEPCPPGSYGLNCEQRCPKCEHGRCNATDGKCECLPGWMGPNCQEGCPKGYFGVQCVEQCQCSNETQTCLPSTGCTCKPGRKGDDCEVEAPSPQPRRDSRSETGGSGLGALIAGITVTLLAFLVIPGLMFYVRKAIRRRKEESAGNVKFLNSPLPAARVYVDSITSDLLRTFCGGKPKSGFHCRHPSIHILPALEVFLSFRCRIAMRLGMPSGMLL